MKGTFSSFSEICFFHVNLESKQYPKYLYSIYGYFKGISSIKRVHLVFRMYTFCVENGGSLGSVNCNTSFIKPIIGKFNRVLTHFFVVLFAWVYDNCIISELCYWENMCTRNITCAEEINTGNHQRTLSNTATDRFRLRVSISNSRLSQQIFI